MFEGSDIIQEPQRQTAIMSQLEAARKKEHWPVKQDLQCHLLRDINKWPLNLDLSKWTILAVVGLHLGNLDKCPFSSSWQMYFVLPLARGHFEMFILLSAVTILYT